MAKREKKDVPAEEQVDPMVQRTHKFIRDGQEVTITGTQQEIEEAVGGKRRVYEPKS